MKNIMDNKFKYFSIKSLIFSPKKYISEPSIKNLADLPIDEASMNVARFILKTPAVIVKTLYGIGVKAAPRIAKNAFSLYFIST